MLTPVQMFEIVRSIASEPGYGSPFEIIHSGITGGTDVGHDREVVAAYQQVGVTWWVEKILVLATWVIRSKILDFRRNDFSLRSNFSLTGDAV